jgi:hypothetical protein
LATASGGIRGFYDTSRVNRCCEEHKGTAVKL